MFIVLLLLALLVNACGAAPTPTPAPAVPTTAQAAPTAVPPTPTRVPPTATPVPPPPTATPTPVDLVIWYPLPTEGLLKEAMDALVAKYNQTHPNARVTMVLTGNYADNYTKLLAGVAANVLPDAAMVELLQIPKLASAKQIIALDDLAKDADFKADDLAKALMGNSYYDNKLYAIPWQRSTTMMFYNRDMFKAAGLDPNKPPTTWEELQQIAPKLLVKQGDAVTQWPVMGTLAGDWFFEGQLLAYGGGLLSADGKTALYNSDVALKGLAIWNDMAKKDKTLSVRGGAEFGAVTSDFIAGKSAMIIHSIFSRAAIEQGAKFDWGVAAVPGGSAGPVLNAGGGNFVIFNKTNEVKRKLAWEFIKWMTASENTAFYAIKSGYLPVRTSALDDPQMKDYLAKSPKAKDAIEIAFKYGKARAIHKDFEKAINQFLNPALQDILQGTADAKTALDAAVKKSNEELAK
jgi:sn-glycerol 3-phosphate transport system substrate-binding protein